MASGTMARNEENIPHSALYTAATWKWGGMPCAELTTPEGAEKLFSLVNAYMKFYRFINPAKYSLHHTLLHRHSMINYLMERSGADQVIEVAAGFSPRGAYVSQSPHKHYFEVDLDDVVRLKQIQLQKSEAGIGVLKRPNFSQLSENILSLDFSTTFPRRRSFVITEGLMMYFSRAEQQQIWRRIAEFINWEGGEYVFDYIPLDIEPDRSVVGKVLHQVKEWLGGDGQGYCYDQRTRFDIREDLLEAGFKSVDIIESQEKSKSWKLPHGQVPTHIIVYQCH